MPAKLTNALILLTFLLFIPIGSASARAQTAQDLNASQLIAQCEQKSGDNRFELHHCLLGEFERLQKITDRLTDELLGMVGKHRSFGRLKIIQWSNAITKSQSRWQSLVPWDCEWEGHILPTAKGAAVAIDRCGVKMAAKRVQFLEKRVEAFNMAIQNDKKKEK